MLGRHHLTLTLLTATIVIIPYIETFYGLVALLGVAIGSLIPDSDSPDAMIFHDNARISGGTGDLINKYFSPFFPLFGYTTKYLIYKPSATLYRALGLDIEEKHHGLMHSMLGALTATALTAIYLSVVLWFLEFLDYRIVAIFTISYILGIFMHLLEDSLTVSGIKWLYPFSDIKLKGKIRTTTESEDMRKPDYLTYFLGAVLAAAYGINLGLSPVTISAALGLFMAISWIVFSLLSGLSLER